MLAGEGHGHQRAAVVGALDGDEFMAAGVGLGEHRGHLIGLGAGVREEADLHVGVDGLGLGREALGEGADGGVEVEGRVVLEEVDLSLERLDEARMGVADGHGGHAGEGIEIFLAVLVVQELHPAFDDLDGLGEHGPGKGEEVLGAHGRRLCGSGPEGFGRGVLGLHEGLRSSLSSKERNRQSPAPESNPSRRFTGEGMRETGFQGLLP